MCARFPSTLSKLAPAFARTPPRSALPPPRGRGCSPTRCTRKGLVSALACSCCLPRLAQHSDGPHVTVRVLHHYLPPAMASFRDRLHDLRARALRSLLDCSG